MDERTLNLAALIGSRICHDLISPIGAINNGLELLEMTTPSDGPEFSLISESVENASARIRFFRVAYGAAGEQLMGPSEVTSILEDMGKSGRLAVSWGPKDPQPRAQVRLIFLALQCFETAMPYGGKVKISQENDQWTLIGTASKLNVDAALWNGLTGAPVRDNISPAQVQFSLLPLISAEMGRTVRVDIAETELKLTL
jgi:histidine phosphotransferase ChpT